MQAGCKVEVRPPTGSLSRQVLATEVTQRLLEGKTRNADGVLSPEAANSIAAKCGGYATKIGGKESRSRRKLRYDGDDDGRVLVHQSPSDKMRSQRMVCWS